MSELEKAVNSQQMPVVRCRQPTEYNDTRNNNVRSRLTGYALSREPHAQKLARTTAVKSPGIATSLLLWLATKCQWTLWSICLSTTVHQALFPLHNQPLLMLIHRGRSIDVTAEHVCCLSCLRHVKFLCLTVDCSTHVAAMRWSTIHHLNGEEVESRAQ